VAHVCDNVSLIAPPKFHLQKPAIVELLIITDLRGSHFVLGHPVDKIDIITVF